MNFRSHEIGPVPSWILYKLAPNLSVGAFTGAVHEDLVGTESIDFRCILCDRAIAGKFAGTRNIQNCPFSERIGIGPGLAKPSLCVGIGAHIRQVHVEITTRKKCFPKGLENPAGAVVE